MTTLRKPLAAAALAAGLAFLAGCRSNEAAPPAAAEAPALAVVTVKVQARPFTASVAVTGTLVSKSQVDIKAETTGRVVRFDKDEGDRVASGEPVVWVDEENYKLAVSQAESAVAVAQAALEKARVMEAHSRSEHERARNLLASGGITDRDLKAAAVAEKDAAAQVALAEAQLAQARSVLDQSRKRLRDAVVRAPVAGEIQRKYVNAGAYVEPPTPVFSLVDNGRLELEAPVPTADLAPVRTGQRVTFQVNSYPGETFRGVVEEINPAVDAASRSAKVRVRVDNAGGRLKAGMFAQGEILTGAAVQAILVPAAAVYREDRASRESYVYVVQNGKAARRAVQIGRERDGELEIAGGLQPGDILVAQQSIQLAEGVPVKAQ
ncbi:MAG: efflux RND transporter periplasmic adaptor subunit [Bryobacterales bacterium]|nr:efflux RND transporter periplasmic adaptor subunit [Bryobacterales bacterium]